MNQPLYFDVAKFLSGKMPPAPQPVAVQCDDGIGLFYANQVNLIFGDPESGKTWLALAAVVESLAVGRRCIVIDLDHNGAAATIRRLYDLGATPEQLSNPDLFRYVEPEDGPHLNAIVADLKQWKPAVVVVDSLGEVLPLYGASSNSPDDFTRVHTNVIKPMATAGACVLLIDHLAKGAESRQMGSTGTAAKKRAVGGVSIRVKVADQFTPGKGGSAHLSISKDRHGGLREHRPTGDKEPLAGTFRLYPEGPKRWAVIAPQDGQRNPSEAPPADDQAAILALDPPPETVREARERLGIRQDRAAAALKWLKAQNSNVTSLPSSDPVTGNRDVSSALPVTRPQGTVTGNDTKHTYADADKWTDCTSCHIPFESHNLTGGKCSKCQKKEVA
ncbi:AAA family ATPase [Actinomycetaceae bacterium WB03_NA08]|uniref:AAA family ATPase n=1 Tax=Scrofimicrobium canadense TaxID=2652290 RepID=A0A6N7W7R4_9ACTO|nr:AAA family ATPase [Scrofimicrobium canadense]MSS84543.1 AAA family ATPase [Scrofimicrobium canadense]